MRRKNVPRATVALPLPSQYIPYASAGASTLFNPPMPYVDSAYNVKPWPIAQTPPRGLGKLAPGDSDFTERHGDDLGIGWQRTEFRSNTIWAQADTIAAAKELEHDLFISTPQSRMHDLSQFNSAFVSQPPQTYTEIPDFPY